MIKVANFDSLFKIYDREILILYLSDKKVWFIVPTILIILFQIY